MRDLSNFLFIFHIAVLGRLKALCNVLASNYNDKIDELGIVKGMEITEATKTRLLKIVLFLQETKEERFEKVIHFLSHSWQTGVCSLMGKLG
jgi:hypothetical protein